MPQASHAYAYGRVRVLESTLITSEKLKRVLEAKSAKDALKALLESGFGAGEQVSSVYEYETLIKRDLEDAYKFVHEVTPESKITDLFFYKYDYHNAKVLMKAKLLNENADNILIPYGAVEVELLKQAIGSEARIDLPEGLKELVYSFKNDPNLEASEIGYLADGALYKQIANELTKVKDKGVKEYFNAQADYNNVLSLLRSRLLGDASLINKAYLSLGKLSLEDMFNAFDKPDEELTKLFKARDLDAGILSGVEYFFENKTMSTLEKNKDNYFIKLFKPMRNEPFVIEPVLGYLLAKEQQANIVRLIMVAKINDLPNDAVLERLRDLYE